MLHAELKVYYSKLVLWARWNRKTRSSEEFSSKNQWCNTISVLSMNSVSIWAINYQLTVPVSCKTDMSCTVLWLFQRGDFGANFKFQVIRGASVLVEMSWNQDSAAYFGLYYHQLGSLDLKKKLTRPTGPFQDPHRNFTFVNNSIVVNGCE